MFPAPSGSAYWRMIDPAKYMRKEGIDVQIVDSGINDEIAKWADVYVLENCIDMRGIALLYAYKQKYKKKIVSDWDDFFRADDSNIHKKLHEVKQFPEISEVVLKISDMLTVTTEHLRRKYLEYNDNIVVLENNMDLERWDRPKKENKSDHVRIGWAGSLTHIEDLRLIEKPLKKILREFFIKYLLSLLYTLVLKCFIIFIIESLLLLSSINIRVYFCF